MSGSSSSPEAPKEPARPASEATRAVAPKDPRSEEAQASLDQLRTQAGGALSGLELRRRFGMDGNEEEGEPPLDWRLTPRNVILQILAVALFIGVVWFFVALITDSLSVLFG